MTLDQFIQKYKGKTVCYPEGKYCGQCLSLVKIYIKEVFGIDPPASGCNGARCYWSIFPSPLDSIFEKVPNRPDLVPKKGWVAVWDGNVGGGAGHIGIVADDKATKSTFNSFDSNWGSKTAQIVTHNYNNVYGFLVPKGNNMSDMYNGYDLSNRESMKVAVDVLVRVQKGEFVEKSKLDDLVKIKTAELSSKISDYENQIKNLNQQLENCANQPVPPAPSPKIFEEMLQQIKKMEDTGGKVVVDKEGQVSVEISYKKEN